LRLSKIYAPLSHAEARSDSAQETSASTGRAQRILEIATTSVACGQKEDQTLSLAAQAQRGSQSHAPESSLRLCASPRHLRRRIRLGDQAKRKVQETILLNWRAASGIAAGLGEIAALPDSVSNKAELAATAQSLLRAMLDYRNSGLTINTLVAVHSEYAIPDVLRALAAFKPADLEQSHRRS
jgi:hypothetical protein